MARTDFRSPRAGDCQPHERQLGDTEQQYGAGASMGRVGLATESERQMSDRNGGSYRPNVRTCQSCCHYVGEVGEHGGKCTVGTLTSPITGERYGGKPERPLSWQPAVELRTALPAFTTCGPFGDQWEAIF
jgi:hypothetical protein